MTGTEQAADSPSLRAGLRSAFAIVPAVTIVSAAAVAIAGGRDLAPQMLLAAAVPPSIALGFAAFAARFPVRALPLRETPPVRLVLTHLVSAMIAGALWLALWNGWLAWLGQPVSPSDVRAIPPLGALIYATAVVVHYLLAEAEAASRERQSALRYRLLAREAELRAFKAQVNPHFLFNSLNAISALCGTSPGDARRMSQLLADFFRRTVRVGGERSVPLREEIDLATEYLEIEKIRFGRRLEFRIDAAGEVLEWRIPPLLLQPLVENAVRHGVASMIDGGAVTVTASVDHGGLRISVENPADPDREPARGEGVGMANVRGRLEAMYGDAAEMRVTESDGTFRVDLRVPAPPERPGGGAAEEGT
jgi:two-component system, LytTR family, sensor histidine kinase AlgZ